MPERKFDDGSEYRYGFNGKELDNNMDGNNYDYGFRIYNPRLGRFLSIDPFTSSYPYYTPYQFAGNMPIAAIDLDGLEQHVVIYYKDENGNTTNIQVRTISDNAGNLLNQHVHKVSDTKDIAKGNVLVFESYQEKNGYENMKVVKSRNIPESKLTAKELEIYSKYKKKEKEQGATQSVAYGGNPEGNPHQYISQDFENADTKTFSSNVSLLDTKTPILVAVGGIWLAGNGGVPEADNGVLTPDMINGLNQAVEQLNSSINVTSVQVSMTYTIGQSSTKTQVNREESQLKKTQSNIVTYLKNRVKKTINVSVGSSQIVLKDGPGGSGYGTFLNLNN